MPTLNNHTHFIPLAHRRQFLIDRRNQTVERARRSLRILTVVVLGVVKHLHLWPRLISRVKIFRDQVDDPTVAARADLPLQFQFKIAKLLARDNVSGLAARDGAQRAVLYLPYLVRKTLLLVATPGS